MGTNGAGLSVLWTAIGSSDRPSHPTETVPTVVLLREILQFATLDGAVDYLRNAPRGVPNNFILSQPGAGLVNVLNPGAILKGTRYPRQKYGFVLPVTLLLYLFWKGNSLPQ